MRSFLLRRPRSLRALLTAALAWTLPALLAWGVAIAPVQAETLSFEIFATTPDGPGDSLGTVTATDANYGLLLTPNLHDLSPGIHGFHIHAKGSCEPAEKNGAIVPALAAGGHFDPQQTGRHLGPYRDGHAGDLPPLLVAETGVATLPVLAPRLTVAAIKRQAAIVHGGGDNYADEPAPLGGGGPRVGCGLAS